jgi:alpha-tubulin suppressor-like RCC1 family protein
MKQKLQFFLVCCFGFTLSQAQQFTYNGIKYEVTDAVNFEVEVDQNFNFIGSAIIPETVSDGTNNFTVTSIGIYAFYNCTNLISVIIPNSITRIGTRSFEGCSSLNSVSIPNSVTSIGAYAFQDCANLTSFIIPNSVTSIEALAFYNCSGLTSIVIPNSVTNIGIYAFSQCTSLTSVVLPNIIENIQDYTFSGCSNLTSITIPNSVTSIGSYAFNGCASLTSITIPNSVTSIQKGSFQFCNLLTSIVIPSSVTTIQDDAFRYCTSAISLTIPNSVTSIGNYAFGSCYDLTSIEIPDTVTSIGNGAFAYLYNLNSFTVNWQTPLNVNANVFVGTAINGKTLNVPSGTEYLYDSTPVWTEFNIVLVPRACWAELSIGSQHSLAIAQDGTLWAWGNQNSGQLGNNSTSGNVLSPTQISNEPNWAFISAGEFYSLAIKKDGTLWAWGDNSSGQLGIGNTTQQNTPVKIGTDTNWIGVYAGYGHSMARKADNSLWSWGNNTSGQLGINSTAVQQTPIQVGVATNWQSVSLGRNHTVALKSNGELWAWGSSTFGQLGTGNSIQQLLPIQIGTDKWKFIEAGDYHNLAINSDGKLYSWGDNFTGQLGLGDTLERNIPTQVGTDTDWKSIAAGLYNGYATKSTGVLFAWGDNFKGQLGNGNFTIENSPVQVGSATDWHSVIAGNEYAIAQNYSGTFNSWGDNQSGQLGNGATLPNNTGQNTPGVMGCAGNILAFDGVDDRVEITNTGTGFLGDNTANESYTIEMKVKLNSFNSLNILFAKYGILPVSGFIIYTDPSGYLNFGQSYGGVLSIATSSFPLSTGIWYRIVAAFDYASKIYVNGVLEDTKTETGSPDFNSANSGLGYSFGDGTGQYDGDFNDFRAWKVARTATEVASYTRNSQQINSAADLVAHYKFNQGIANTNNAGLTVLANEVIGGPVGTLQNFALAGATSNWTQDISANETLSTNNFTTDDVAIYPNPSTGIFNISLQEDATVEVHDMLGKVIYSNKVKAGNNIIDISYYQSGIYLLNVKTENGSVTKKLIKE